MSATEETPRRLTPTEQREALAARLHEVTMAAMLRPHAEPESSITLARNAKGDVQIEVTVRSVDPGVAYKQARTLFDDAARQYPRTEPTDADAALAEARKVAGIQANRAKAK